MSDLSAGGYMAKARRALHSAKALVAGRDTEGAVNRAYYAMHGAAHAALWAAGYESELMAIKTHDGLIGQFGMRLVKEGPIDASHGRALNQVENIRLKADYLCEPPPLTDAEWSITQAEAFLAAISAAFPVLDD